nr:PAS domain-containing protein [Halomicrobium salinisoli]
MGSSSRADAESAVRRQEIVAELGDRALGGADVDALVVDAVAAVAEALDVDRVAALRLTPDGESLVIESTAGWDGEGERVDVAADSLIAAPLFDDGPVVVEEARADGYAVPEALGGSVVGGAGVTIGPDADPWGVLGVYATERRALDEGEALFLGTVANALATAVQTERARDGEAERAAVLEQATDGFYALDEEWRITRLDDRAERLIDPGGGDFLGEPLWEALEWDVEEALREAYEQARETGSPTAVEAYFPAPLDAWYEFGAHPTGSGLSVYCRDVTDRKARERELEQYETVAETASDVILTIDADSVVQTVNPAVEETFGHAPEDLIGESLTALMPDRYVDSHFGAVERYLETGERHLDWEYLELTGERADGTEIPIAVSFSEYEYGGERYFTGIIRDVSDRVERERELEEYERRYRTLIEHFPNGAVAIVDEDLRYLTLGGDPIAVDATTGEAAEGKPLGAALPDDLAAELRPRYAAALDGAESAYELEYDGRTYEVRIVPVRDESGEVFAALGTSQDVTKHREYERRLEESERRYRTLIEHFPNGAVALFDEDLRYQIAGGKLLDGIDATADAIVGQTVWERYPEDLAERMAEKFREALDGAAQSFEIEFHGRHLQAYTLPIEDEAGNTFAGMIMVQDVTERKKYERRLEESNERLEQFAYAASHDLQEPLRMVSSYLRLIEQRYADELDEDGREFLEFAVDGADRMREMIEGLLEYSRVETRGDPFEPVDLDDVLADVRDDLQVKIAESDAEITTDPLPEVRGDRGQLRQVLQNLLDNAIEYSGDEPPRIDVEAERDGRLWAISVSDEGIGIDPDDADRVFEVFQRLHSHEEHEGTGIGLALCRRIVERHGGEIEIDSEPGDGTIITFTLPPAGDDRA